MTTKRKFNAVTPRPKYGENDGVWWHSVGQAIENEKGQISIYLDSVPVPDPKRENKIVIMLFEKRDEDEDHSGSRRSGSRKDSAAKSGKTRGETDDEIPF